ncbi:hypothetical protein VP01_7951g1, partial [Puccinia sorghi]
MKHPHIFPAGNVLRDWQKSVTPEAKAWEARYSKCILP